MKIRILGFRTGKPTANRTVENVGDDDMVSQAKSNEIGLAVSNVLMKPSDSILIWRLED